MASRPTNRELLEQIAADMAALKDVVIMNDIMDAMARGYAEADLAARTGGRRHRKRPDGERPAHLRIATSVR